MQQLDLTCWRAELEGELVMRYFVALVCVLALALGGCGEGTGGSGGDGGTGGTGGDGGSGGGGAAGDYAWGLAERIDVEGYPESLAVNAEGVALVASAGGVEGALWVIQYVPESGWGTPQQIEGEGLGSAMPQVAIAPNGTAVVVWEEYNNPEEIRASHYTPSDGWTDAVKISPDAAGPGSQGSAYAPQVAMDGAGNAIAAWHQIDSEGNRVVLAARFTPSGRWQEAQPIDGGSADYESWPTVAMDPSGNAVTVWHGDDDQGGRIFASSYTPQDGWTDARRINSPTDGGTGYGPDVDMDAGGNAIAVWVQAGYEGGVWIDRVWSNRFTQDGGWGTAQSFDTTETSYPADPQVSMNAAGLAVAIWQRIETGPERYTIRSARYDPGHGWGAQEQVDTDREDQDYGYDPQVAVDPFGGALAVWQASARIWSSVYTPEEGWGPSVGLDLDDAAQDAADAPLIGVDGMGRGTAVWYDFGTGPWTNRYSEEGTAGAPSDVVFD